MNNETIALNVGDLVLSRSLTSFLYFGIISEIKNNYDPRICVVHWIDLYNPDSRSLYYESIAVSFRNEFIKWREENNL